MDERLTRNQPQLDSITPFVLRGNVDSHVIPSARVHEVRSQLVAKWRGHK